MLLLCLVEQAFQYLSSFTKKARHNANEKNVKTWAPFPMSNLMIKVDMTLYTMI